MSTLMPQSVAFGLTASNAMSPTNANANTSKTPTPTTSAAATYKVPKFLRSLYSILQHEDTSVVTWLQNQELKPNRVTAFHILDLDRFENEVLPKYFKHSKFASFQRQLNNFGFRKWTKTQSSGVCTFSHNCFPPDPREIGVLRASIREQWRQKNTDSRRRVGNGITKAERKLQQQVQQQVQQLQLPVTKHAEKTNKLAESTPTPTGSPAPPTTNNTNTNANTMASPTRVESFSEMLKTPLAPTHQPQVKKLARGDWVSSNAAMDAAFTDAPAKPTHHLPHVSYNNTVNIGSSAPTPTPTFAHHHVPMQPPMMIVTEPWGWHHQAMPAYDVHPAFHHHHPHHPQHQHVGAATMDMWAAPHVRKGVYCHPPEQQVSPSTMEEFTFDSLLLFAE